MTANRVMILISGIFLVLRLTLNFSISGFGYKNSENQRISVANIAVHCPNISSQEVLPSIQ